MSLSMSSNAKTLEGILILGTDTACGKTVLTAGLAAAILEAGFRVQAYKPLVLCPDLSLKQGQDQAFLNKISQQFIQAETLHLPSPWEMTVPLWNKMLDQCKTLQYPCLLEGPGQVSSPWQLLNNQITDGLTIAKDLGLPVLLVSRAEEAFMAKTRAALTFMLHRQITPLGFVRVQTVPTGGPVDHAAHEALMLSQEFAVPFLGDLPYSPSISVSPIQQGNLVRLVQENIDLLPLQMGIGLTL
jgi:dethiobiotin synthetase